MKFISRFFSAFDRVICLSVASSDERRRHIQSLVDTYDIINLELFTAVEKNDHLVKEYYDRGLVKEFPPCFRCGKLRCDQNNCNNTLIPAQVATFLSYTRIWNHILEDRLNTVLIIEDDVKLVSDAERISRSIITNNFLAQSGIYFNSPMLLRFGWALCQDHESKNDYGFLTEIKMANPAHAINRSMVELLISRFERIDTTVDIYQHQMCATKENSKTGYPPLFYEMSWSTGEVESMIHPKKIRHDYLIKNNMDTSHEYVRHQELIRKDKKHTTCRQILATGHPRCGSGYTAKLLQSMGLNVGHESMENNGISSWMFAVFDDKNPYALNDLAVTRNLTYFELLIHYVRDPKEALPSIIRENVYSPDSFSFRRKHIKNLLDIDISEFGSALNIAAASLVYWTKIIENQNPAISYRIEDEEQKLVKYIYDQCLRDIKYDQIQYPSKDINKDKAYKGKRHAKPTITGDGYRNMDRDLLKELNQYCDRYGYYNI